MILYKDAYTKQKGYMGQLQWSDRTLDVEKEVLEFAVEGAKIRIRAAVETSTGICCYGSKDSLERKSFCFKPVSQDLLRMWCERLQQYIDSLGRPKSLFVFVNPYGGKKFASKVFLDVVKPLLKDANIEFTIRNQASTTCQGDCFYIGDC